MEDEDLEPISDDDLPMRYHSGNKHSESMNIENDRMITNTNEQDVCI